MKPYKLLTPGPLTTTDTVKREMLVDHCTWDDDYKTITQKIRRELLKLTNTSEEEYTAVLMQGSGTFGVESVLSSTVGKEDKILICENGEYGKRMEKICSCGGIRAEVYGEQYDRIISAERIKELLQQDGDITHVAMIHCETTTGILNDLQSVGDVCREYNKTFIVDAMSSFGGIPIDLEAVGIDFLISSANKCIEGVPGFSFILAKREKLSQCKGVAQSLSLDLYDQWETMEKDGKWRFTSPTHVVLAFAQALRELKQEGGVEKRLQRYQNNNRILIEGLKKLGIDSYIRAENQSPVITTFYYPQGEFNFGEMYDYIKERGFAIYPGKLTDADTFRIGNIGDIHGEDMEKLVSVMGSYMEVKEWQK